MSNPYILARRAASAESIFPRIDEKNWLWAAEVFEELGRPSAADRARRLAAEFRALAERLDGATPIGAEDEAA